MKAKLQQTKHQVYLAYQKIGNWYLRTQYPDNYSIKRGYQHNLMAQPYLDNESFADSYQTEVYQQVAAYIKKKKLQTVLDVGCGHGVKLKKYIKPLTTQITGVDMPHSISYCRNHYTFGEWIVDNIEAPTHRFKHQFDVVLSVDVIEHLKNPDTLISYLKKRVTPKGFIFVSTPERDLVRGKKHMGPPENPAHVREWNKKELATYLESKGLKLITHKLLRDKQTDTSQSRGNTCQLAICTLNSK